MNYTKNIFKNELVPGPTSLGTLYTPHSVEIIHTTHKNLDEDWIAILKVTDSGNHVTELYQTGAYDTQEEAERVLWEAVEIRLNLLKGKIGCQPNKNGK